MIDPTANLFGNLPKAAHVYAFAVLAAGSAIVMWVLFASVLATAYKIAGAIAALFMVASLLIIVLQMVTRWIGITFPGGTNYAGYCLAGASFFALAHVMNHGAHIRVSLFVGLRGQVSERRDLMQCHRGCDGAVLLAVALWDHLHRIVFAPSRCPGARCFGRVFRSTSRSRNLS